MNILNLNMGSSHLAGMNTAYEAQLANVGLETVSDIGHTISALIELFAGVKAAGRQ